MIQSHHARQQHYYLHLLEFSWCWHVLCPCHPLQTAKETKMLLTTETKNDPNKLFQMSFGVH